MPISPSTLTFLRSLKRNNDRDWFNANKSRYKEMHREVTDFAAEVIRAYGKVEDVPVQDPGKQVFRIYRDIRFSKNKDPYKTHMAFHVNRQPGRLGLYVHLEPGGKSLVATGLWQPSPEVLAAVRQEIDYNADGLRKILARRKFRDTFGELRGDELKTAPKGYATDHPHIDLIRKKQWMAWKYFPDGEVTAKDFSGRIVSTARVAGDFMAFFDEAMSGVKKK